MPHRIAFSAAQPRGAFPPAGRGGVAPVRRGLRLLPLVLALICLLPALAHAGWSTTSRGDVRWLAAPGGERFFSLGVNTIHPGSNDAKAQAGKAYYFARYYPTRAAWGQAAEQRLISWGFNTAGGWSDPDPSFSLPIIPEIDLGRNAKLHWYDIFDPASQDVADAMAREILAPYAGNPRILGYFTDNEVGWWNAPLFLWHLERGWAFYSKRVLWEMLRQRYKGDFAALLKDFVPAPGFDSFEKLKEAGAALKLRPGGQGIKAVNQFTYLIARRYYELVFRAMRKAAPGALVVGDRLPLYYCQDAVLAQRGLVDVLSTNYNVDAPDGWVAPYYFEGLRDLIAAPILISEYFFAADDNRSGNVNNGHLMHVATQPERARGATAALRNFAGFPNVAGVHWFQFADEPTGGRSDGEDFNMGLVDIHDQPYELLTQAFAELTPRIPDIHAASRWEPKPDPALAPVLPRAGAAKSVTDGSILDWPDKRVSRLRGFATPKPYAPFGDVHLAWDQRGLYFMNIAGNYVDLSLLDWQGEFPLSETYQIHITADAGAGPRHFAVHLAPRPHSVWPGRFELAPQLWEYQGGRPVRQLEAKGLVQALDKPLPHIQVEGLIPATELGVPALTPGQRVALSVSVTNFYGELTMTWASRDAVLGQATDNAGATQ